MALPEFTLTAGPEGFSAVTGGATLSAEALAGLEVTFSVNIMGGQFLLVDGGQRWIKDVTVTLDSNGKINGNTGIKLLANDPSLDLEKPIQWTISFSKNFRHLGFRQQFTKWTFIAPDAGDTVGLDELSHATGFAATNVTRGLPGPPGVDDVVSASGGTAIQFRRDGQNVGAAIDLSGFLFEPFPDTVITYYTDGTVQTVTENGVTTTYTYNTDGTVHTDTRNGVTRTYTYDGDGNLTGIEAA